MAQAKKKLFSPALIVTVILFLSGVIYAAGSQMQRISDLERSRDAVWAELRDLRHENKEDHSKIVDLILELMEK